MAAERQLPIVPVRGRTAHSRLTAPVCPRQMNFQQSPFPLLEPAVSCAPWSRLDRRTDAEQELRLQEQQQLDLLARLRQQGSDAPPLGRSTADAADEEDEPEEDEYDDDDNDDEEEDDSEMAEDLDPPIDQRF